MCYDISRTVVTSDLFSMSDCRGKGGTAMDYTMDDAKRMLRRVAEIMRAGLAGDATEEEKAKMRKLVSDDYHEITAMLESLLLPDPKEEK